MTASSSRRDVFGIIFRFAVGQAHVTLDREEIGKQTAGEHEMRPA